MARETIKTHDAELYIGWPTTPEDVERDRSVQVGVRYGVDARWAVLTSPEQVAEYRRQLQRASRAVWPPAKPQRGGLHAGCGGTLVGVAAPGVLVCTSCSAALTLDGQPA